MSKYSRRFILYALGLCSVILSGCSNGASPTPAIPLQSGGSDHAQRVTAVSYKVVELQSLAGTSAAISTDQNGLASGFSVNGGGLQHAVLWHGTVVTDLETLGGPNSAIAWPNHNASGTVVGYSDTADIESYGEPFSCLFGDGYVCRAFAWRDGVMSALPTLGGPDSYAAGSNDLGQIVGWAENTVHDPTCVSPQVLQFEAVIWDANGKIQQLPAYGSDPDTAATAVNDRGQVVGISGICGVAYGGASAAHAVLWQNGSVTDLGSFGGKVFNTAAAVNNRGQVAGWSDLPGDAVFHAFTWGGSGTIQDVGVLPGDTYSLAYAINNQGQVVGQSLDADFNSRAFIYQNGVMTDLNTLVPAGSPYLIFANDINDNGQIVGAAFDSTSGAVVAFRAYPVYGSTVAAASAKRSAQKIALPLSVRVQLRQRGLFGRMDHGIRTKLP